MASTAVRFSLLITTASLVLGSNYFFDLETRVEPIFKQVSLSAFNGMCQSRKLSDALDVEDSLDVNRIQLVVRAKMSEEMEAEVRRVFTGLQHMIDSLREFSKFASDSLKDSQKRIDEGQNIKLIASQFASGLLYQAKMSLGEILMHQKHEKSITDVNSAVLQEMFLRVANEILDDSDLANLEQKITREVNIIVNAVFTGRSALLSLEVLTEELSGLQGSFTELFPLTDASKEAKLNKWIGEQLTVGLQKSFVHISNLRSFAEEVIRSTATQPRRICGRASDYFRSYQNELGQVWGQIEKFTADE